MNTPYVSRLPASPFCQLYATSTLASRTSASRLYPCNSQRVLCTTALPTVTFLVFSVAAIIRPSCRCIIAHAPFSAPATNLIAPILVNAGGTSSAQPLPDVVRACRGLGRRQRTGGASGDVFEQRADRQPLKQDDADIHPRVPHTQLDIRTLLYRYACLCFFTGG